MADGGQLPQMMHMHDTDADVTVLSTEIESADGATAPMMRNANLASTTIPFIGVYGLRDACTLGMWTVIWNFIRIEVRYGLMHDTKPLKSSGQLGAHEPMPLTIAMFESDESTQPLLHWVVIEPFADQPTKATILRVCRAVPSESDCPRHLRGGDCALVGIEMESEHGNLCLAE